MGSDCYNLQNLILVIYEIMSEATEKNIKAFKAYINLSEMIFLNFHINVNQ